LSKVRKLHNNTLYHVKLNVTHRYSLYLEAVSKAELDKRVSDVVKGDMYSLTTDYKPVVVGYDYDADYVSCEESFEEFIRDQDNLGRDS